MKKYFIKLQNVMCRMLCVCAFILFAQSCSQESYNASNKSEQEMNLIAVKYLILDNDRYVLNLSEVDALQLGISESHYKKMLENISETNMVIENIKNDPNAGSISLQNPQDIKLNHVRLKSGGNENSNKMLYRGQMTPTAFGSRYTYSIGSGISKVKFIFCGASLISTASITINGGGLSNYVVNFISAISISDEETVNVALTPTTLNINAVLFSGGGYISVHY
jgi:hypothetical protein